MSGIENKQSLENINSVDKNINFADVNKSPDENLGNLSKNTKITESNQHHEYQCSIEEQWNDIDKCIELCHSEKWTKFITDLLNNKYWFKQADA